MKFCFHWELSIWGRLYTKKSLLNIPSYPHRLIIFADFSIWKNWSCICSTDIYWASTMCLLNWPGTEHWFLKACSCHDLDVRGEGSPPAHWALKSPRVSNSNVRNVLVRSNLKGLWLSAVYLQDKLVGEEILPSTRSDSVLESYAATRGAFRRKMKTRQSH